MENSRLFMPLSLGRCELQHRLVMSPLTRVRADDLFVLLPFVKQYYAQRASTPGTLIIAEATAISQKAVGLANAPGIWSPEQIAAWRQVTDGVHEKGSFIYLQLWAGGRVVEPDVVAKEGIDHVSSSATPIEPRVDNGGPINKKSAAVPLKADQRCPRPLSESEISEYIADYAQAARNAMTAGFDGVEIHGAHGFLIDQFTQGICNKRTDRWGGSIENRSRFALEVTKAVADAIGADRVGIKLSPWAEQFGMRITSETIPQFQHLIGQLRNLGLAYLSLGNPRWNEVNPRDQSESNITFVRTWGTGSPVILAGGYSSISAQEAVDQEYAGYTVLIAFGRHFISNPDLPFRVKRGLEFNPYKREKFYAPWCKEGYIDYPFSEEFKAEYTVS